MTDLAKLSGEERIKEIKTRVDAIAQELKRLHPEVEIVESKYSTKVIYYTVSVVKGEIKTSKHDISLTIRHDPEKIARGRFLTKEEAKLAIEAVFPKAKEKFEKCLEAHRNLCKELGFSTGFNYDGDTYGIYNEYDYICFELDGFDFQFEIGN